MQPPRVGGDGGRSARPAMVVAAAVSVVWALCVLPHPSSCTPTQASTSTTTITDEAMVAEPEWVPRGDKGGGGGGGGDEPTSGGGRELIMMHEMAMKEALAGVQQRQGLPQGITMYGQGLGQGLEQGDGHGLGQGTVQGMTPGMGHETAPAGVTGLGLGSGTGISFKQEMGAAFGQGLAQGPGQGFGQGLEQGMTGFGQGLGHELGPGLGQGLGPGLAQGHGPLISQDQSGQATWEPMVDLRHILPELNLENNTVTDVNANAGDVAHLPCRFPQLSTLHQKAFLLLQVSWIRRTDFHILTTGVYTYTTDMRFSVLHPEGSDDWTLQIKYAEERDNGTYECQMYTGTGVLSQFVNLHVNRPRAAILGPHELHVQEGDTITLVCVIQQQGKPPFVFWYHGEKMVNYDGSRNRLSVMTKVEGTRTHSRLTITDARSWDSGNYSCIPPNVEPSNVIVFVTEGDNVAAVQRRGHSSASPLWPAFWSSFTTPSTSSLLLVVVAKAVFTHLLPVR